MMIPTDHRKGLGSLGIGGGLLTDGEMAALRIQAVEQAKPKPPIDQLNDMIAQHQVELDRIKGRIEHLESLLDRLMASPGVEQAVTEALEVLR